MWYFIVGLLLWAIDSIFILMYGEEETWMLYVDDPILKIGDCPYKLFKLTFSLIGIFRILLWPVTVIGSIVYLIRLGILIREEVREES